jgi:hypothetical protein
MRHFLPIVNQVSSLLPAALAGCCNLWPFTTIIDNREQSKECDADLAKIAPGIQVYNPPVPLTTAQTMNLMLRLAVEHRLPFFTWQHLDAVCLADTSQGIPALARELLARGEPWGAILTRSELARPVELDGKIYRAIATDAFSAYNTQALLTIGGWDWLRFPYYVLDSDLHIRLERSGYPVITTEFQVDHLCFSQTLRSSPERSVLAEAHWPLWRQLFSEKHGVEFWDYELYQ